MQHPSRKGPYRSWRLVWRKPPTGPQEFAHTAMGGRLLLSQSARPSPIRGAAAGSAVADVSLAHLRRFTASTWRSSATWCRSPSSTRRWSACPALPRRCQDGIPPLFPNKQALLCMFWHMFGVRSATPAGCFRYGTPRLLLLPRERLAGDACLHLLPAARRVRPRGRTD